MIKRISSESIARATSYDEINTKNLRVDMMDTSVIDPPVIDYNKFLIIVQAVKGKPSDNLIRSVNQFIKTKKPIYVLQFNDDFLEHFDDFEPQAVNYFEPEKNEFGKYIPNPDFLEEYMNFVNDDVKELLK